MVKGFLKLGLVVLYFLTCYSQVFAQVKLTFDTLTGNLTIDPVLNKWIPGEVVSIYVIDYNPSKFPYKIEYSSSEKINNKGLGVFEQLTKTAKDLSPLAETTSTLYSQYIVDNKDVSHITIIKIDNAGKELNKRVISFPVRGGLKFDISTGAFLHNIVDEIYILAPDPNGRRIVKENNGNINVGTGLLLHLHSRQRNSWNIGISMGFEIDNDAKIGYLLGPSVLIGFDQKFVFTFGAILRNKLVISEAYKDVDVVDNSIIEIPRASIWAVGGFFAGTYNF